VGGLVRLPKKLIQILASPDALGVAGGRALWIENVAQLADTLSAN